MTPSNETQRVLLSEQFEDDLYYTATVTLERTEVCFNRDSVVFEGCCDEEEQNCSQQGGRYDQYR